MKKNSIELKKSIQEAILANHHHQKCIVCQRSHIICKMLCQAEEATSCPDCVLMRTGWLPSSTRMTSSDSHIHLSPTPAFLKTPAQAATLTWSERGQGCTYIYMSVLKRCTSIRYLQMLSFHYLNLKNKPKPKHEKNL